MSVPNVSGSSVSSACKSMTISLDSSRLSLESSEERCYDDDDVFISEEGTCDSSDEYDTDLDLPMDARSPPPETPEKDKLDVICREIYKKACTEKTPISTYPQKKIENGLSERSLKLKYRSLGSAAVRPLSVAMTNNLRVERLDLQYADIGTQGVKDLATSLSDNITVSYLNLGNNNIGTDGVKWVAYLLMKNRLIKHLSLEGNHLNDNAAPHLALAIEHNTSLSILDLSHNQFCDNGPKVIAAALGLNTGLETFRMSWNHIRGKGAVAICQSLKYNETLKLLDVSMNGFGYEGSVAMTETLKVNTTLRELDMSANRITWRGALLLSSGLRDNIGLEILRLGKNPLTTTGCMDITGAISSPDSHVKFLDLTGVSILVENEVLADAIRMRKDFKFLHGGIVMTPDVLGERKERKKDHMEIVMEYLRSSCIRPIEMLRDYDKTVNFKVSQESFVDRLVRAGIPLHKFEMRALAKAITENDKLENADKIDYANLVASVTEQIFRDRVRIRKEKFHIRKTKQHHKRILASGLPNVPYDRSSGQGKHSSSQNDGSPSAINFSNLDLGTLSFTSLPSLPEEAKGDSTNRSLRASWIIEEKKPVNRSVSKPKLISMSAPLEDFGKKKKKKLKKVKKKKTSKVNPKDHVETLVSKTK